MSQQRLLRTRCPAHSKSIMTAGSVSYSQLPYKPTRLGPLGSLTYIHIPCFIQLDAIWNTRVSGSKQSAVLQGEVASVLFHIKGVDGLGEGGSYGTPSLVQQRPRRYVMLCLLLNKVDPSCSSVTSVIAKEDSILDVFL
jgi:hypothetical protein